MRSYKKELEAIANDLLTQRLRLGEVGELYPQKLNKVQMLIKITKDE